MLKILNYSESESDDDAKKTTTSTAITTTTTTTTTKITTKEKGESYVNGIVVNTIAIIDGDNNEEKNNQNDSNFSVSSFSLFIHDVREFYCYCAIIGGKKSFFELFATLMTKSIEFL